MLFPVILCGGGGQRLWPASRPRRPKPFIPLIGGRSGFLEALARAALVPGAMPPVVVTGAAQAAIVRKALAGQTADLILEPDPRDTALAIAAAARMIGDRAPEGVLMILPADHHIPDAAAFARAAARAASAAAEGWIVTLGVPPTGASSRYGYIVPGDIAGDARRIAAFIEKPGAALARTLAAEGCLWNCGVFLARADVLGAEMAGRAPEVHAAAVAAVADGARRGRTLRLGPAALAAPAIAFDHAVMEATERGLVIPCDFSWSDLGTWDAVLAAATRDADGNHAVGAVALDRTRECIVRAADGMTAVVVGGQRLAVIVERDEVLVCDLAQAEGLKRALARAGSISAGRR